MNIDIRIPKNLKDRKRGVVKYGEVPSESKDGVKYSVAKLRRRSRGTHGKFLYSYACTCPDYVFRARECKHLAKFKEAEKCQQK